MTTGAVLDSEIYRVEGDRVALADDVVAVEEPLEIQLSGPNGGFSPVAVTMRTPGEDHELALGFLLSEGVIRSATAVESIEPWGPLTGEDRIRNSIRVQLRAGESPSLVALDRHFFTNSACGVCGKASLEALRTRGIGPVDRQAQIAPAIIHGLPDVLRASQRTFATTGGLHAAGLFTAGGRLLLSREDVGRHNAVDKVIGAMARVPQPEATVLAVSGRASFELVQKAACAQLPVLAAVGAPSSLAVQLARALNMTLLGFVRGGRFNIYSHPGRVALDLTTL